MAFTGTPTIIRISDRVVKILGLQLASGASGTISLHEGAGEVKMPDSINWGAYAGKDAGDDVVQLVEAVEVGMHFVTDPGTPLEPSYRVVHTKSGIGPANFLITFTNHDVGQALSAVMEMYIRFH
jgi:hypothetical protein